MKICLLLFNSMSPFSTKKVSGSEKRSMGDKGVEVKGRELLGGKR